MRSIIINTFIVIVLLAAAFGVMLQVSTVHELLHPVRVTAEYVKLHEAEFTAQLKDASILIHPHFYDAPEDLGMTHVDLEVKTPDSITLKAWFIPSRFNINGMTLLILHDINESRITLLEHAKQFYDRGFNVVLPDLRAHGESGGVALSFGIREPADLVVLLDTLYGKKELAKYFDGEPDMIVMGIGLGASVAVQLAVADPRIHLLIAQSPYDRLANYIRSYSKKKWGVFNPLFFPLMKYKVGMELGVSVDSVNTIAAARKIIVPALIVIADKDHIVPPALSQRVYNAISDSTKELLDVSNAGHFNMDEVEGGDYYNKIALFIVNSVPPKIKRSKFRKLV